MSKFVKIFSVIVDLLVSVLPVLQSLSKKDEKKDVSDLNGYHHEK